MTAPLTESGQPMKRVRDLGGWCDPDCTECNGTGIDQGEVGEVFGCSACFLDGKDVLKARDYCPPIA